jgi:hypothetical protein
MSFRIRRRHLANDREGYEVDEVEGDPILPLRAQF